MDKICLVVLNYNDSETTIKFIKNVKAYDSIHKIIVVDNSSADNSYSEIKKHTSEKVKLVRTDKNGGYSYGNNFGIKYAINEFNPQYIIISNPDVRFNESIISPMLDVFRKNTGIALVSPKMEHPSGKKVITAWKLPDWKDNVIFLFNSLGKLYNNMIVYSENELKGELSIVDVLPGSFFMADVEKLKSIGFFDEDTFLYCEEIILSYRLKQAGYKCALLNKIAYIHDHSISINKSYDSTIKKYELLMNSIRIYNKKYLKISKAKELIYNASCHLCILEKYVILWVRNFL